MDRPLARRGAVCHLSGNCGMVKFATMNLEDTGTTAGNALPNAALAFGRRERDIVYWGPACGRFSR